MDREVTAGRTRWGRFAAVLVAGLAGAAALLFGVSGGALAASFTVSGTMFKTSASELRGEGFVLYGGTDRTADAAHPVAVGGFRSVVMDDFCQSVLLPRLPLLGEVTLKMTSAGTEGMSATDMLLGIDEQFGDLTLVRPSIGVDASQLTEGPPGSGGLAGSFSMQAPSARMAPVRQTAWSATAQTMRLRNLAMSITLGRHECF